MSEQVEKEYILAAEENGCGSGAGCGFSILIVVQWLLECLLCARKCGSKTGEIS